MHSNSITLKTVKLLFHYYFLFVLWVYIILCLAWRTDSGLNMNRSFMKWQCNPCHPSSLLSLRCQLIRSSLSEITELFHHQIFIIGYNENLLLKNDCKDESKTHFRILLKVSYPKTVAYKILIHSHLTLYIHIWCDSVVLILYIWILMIFVILLL